MWEVHVLSFLSSDIIKLSVSLADSQTCHQSPQMTAVGEQDYGESQTQLQCSGTLTGLAHDKCIVSCSIWWVKIV